jgi:hypothetical protein
LVGLLVRLEAAKRRKFQYRLDVRKPSIGALCDEGGLMSTIDELSYLERHLQTVQRIISERGAQDILMLHKKEEKNR